MRLLSNSLMRATATMKGCNQRAIFSGKTSPTECPARPSIAVIILTFNEEQNISQALDSVIGWAKEVFVVDSFSTDRTVNIALERTEEGVRVVQHAFENYSAQWNWALAHLPCCAEWTLKLDADEIVTEEFKTEIAKVLASENHDMDGIMFRRQLVFMGCQLKWGGLADNYDLRMWRTGRARFENRSVNEHAIVKGRITKIRSFILHNDVKSLTAWIDRHNRYASLEAVNILAGNMTGDVSPQLLGTPVERRMWLRKLYYGLPGRAVLYFLYRFLFRLGFLDGAPGFRYTFLHATFFYWIDLKKLEYRTTGRIPLVHWPTRGMPNPIVAASELQRTVNRECSKSPN